ncbi:hypothetical protein [Catellatospora sp. NPDC049609]|uniref:hypothetical protein n=1 Tax=Catellatospora sp. NPDC049609 TaxID=3155505 RepID=UPI0034198959
MTSIEPDQDVSPASRAARAAGCAFLSLAVWMGIAYLLIQLRDCQSEGFQCLGDALGIMFLCLLGAMATMWPLLRLVRVRPAWPVALAGPGVLALLAFGWLVRGFLNSPQLWVVAVMVAYAVGAVLVDRAVAARVRWIVLGVLVALVVAQLVAWTVGRIGA